MSDITLEYLLYIKKIYGGQKLIQQTNCNCNIQKPGDYIFTHGTVNELIQKIQNGEKLHLV